MNQEEEALRARAEHREPASWSRLNSHFKNPYGFEDNMGPMLENNADYVDYGSHDDNKNIWWIETTRDTAFAFRETGLVTLSNRHVSFAKVISNANDGFDSQLEELQEKLIIGRKTWQEKPKFRYFFRLLF